MRQFKCKSCQALFSAKTDMKRHNRIVHEERTPFKCESCNATFTNVSKLKKHQRDLGHEQKTIHECECHPLPVGSLKFNLSQHSCYGKKLSCEIKNLSKNHRSNFLQVLSLTM